MFYFSEDIETRTNKTLIESLLGEIMTSSSSLSEICLFFSESSVYNLLRLPPYIKSAIENEKSKLFINQTHAEAFLGAGFSHIAELKGPSFIFLPNDEFLKSYSEFARKTSARILKL